VEWSLRAAAEIIRITEVSHDPYTLSLESLQQHVFTRVFDADEIFCLHVAFDAFMLHCAYAQSTDSLDLLFARCLAVVRQDREAEREVILQCLGFDNLDEKDTGKQCRSSYRIRLCQSMVGRLPMTECVQYPERDS
jgi:hypothetical protein